MITLDTSALFALLNRKDPDHGRVKALLLSDPGPYLVPMGILAEIAYLAERRLGLGALEAFLQDLEAGAFSLECGEEDLPRVRALVARYRDLPLGFADLLSMPNVDGGLVGGASLELESFLALLRIAG